MVILTIMAVLVIGVLILTACTRSEAGSIFDSQDNSVGDGNLEATQEIAEIVDSTTPRPVTESNIVLLLSQGTYQERINAISVVYHLDNPAEFLPLLVQNLRYRNGSKVNRTPAYIIGTIGENAVSAGPDLVVALDDDDIHVQREAAKALGKLSHPSAVPYLVKLLYKDHENSLTARINSAIAA